MNDDRPPPVVLAPQSSLAPADPSAPTVSGPSRTSALVDSEACDSWTKAGANSPTVSTARLAVPGKASSEYQKACGAFKVGKLREAEDHVRKAIELYPSYAAAWVVLGQVLRAEDKKDDARGACSQAQTLDPGYVAPYLCLAEFASIAKDWEEAARFADQALALDPTGNPYALYYAADAGLHLNQLSQAEIHARSAVKLDTSHILPELHLLLANIYEAEGDSPDEAVQLQEFLKYAANSPDAAAAKTALAQVESKPAK
jgi:tetratricopeptide (TPR) repeat protein